MRLFHRCGLAFALLLTAATAGCSPPRTPADMLAGTPVRLAAGGPPPFHVASLIVLDVNEDLGVAAALAPQAATFPEGDVGFVVLTKWLALEPGSYTQRIHIVAPDGQSQLRLSALDFEVQPGLHAVTTAESVELAGAAPGQYLVVVELNGSAVARYPFWVAAPEPST